MIMSSYNELKHRDLCISNDFGKGFVFSDKQSIRISEKEFEGYSSGKSQLLDETYNGSSLLVFSGGMYPKVLRLRQSIPTFDSADREYDSWHELYLVQENDGHIHAVYAKGGYRIAGIEKIPDVLKYPKALKRHLKNKTTRFSLFHIV